MHFQEIMEITSDKNILTAETIETFILQQDKYFVPTIASKVNLAEYSQKLLSKASLAFAIKDNVLLGLIAFYCNNSTNKKAYISYLAIDGLYRGKGLGRKLLSSCIKSCIEANMISIEVETWASNTAGIQLYTSMGFSMIELVNDRPNEKTARLKIEF